MKQLGAQPGDFLDAGVFQIGEHSQLGLSAAQSADRIAQKFADISQEYPPLNIRNLPTRVGQKIQNAQFERKPFISRKLVAEKILKAKNTKGGVSGDLPVKLAKEFRQELSIRAARIFNNIVQIGKWPER